MRHFLSSSLRKSIKYLLLLYQKAVRPLVGSHCRFYPSCSDYAMEAVESYGCAAGLRMTMWRILRCSQWSRGGVDPVR